MNKQDRSAGQPVVDPRELRERVREILPEITAFRRVLHGIPELGMEEKKTAAAIRERLAGQAVALREPFLETDTVALMEGATPGGNVTLRADIDALPMRDEGGKPWASTHPGCSHACGHDGHTAMLIGAVKVLEGLRDRFAGTVRFVFQPAEESFGGGRKMVEMGLLNEAPEPDAVYALHAWPFLAPGQLAARKGPALAACDRFTVTFRGPGGHGAKPHETADTLLAATQAVQHFQTIVSRSVNPVEPAVVSVCSFHSGEASNVIPDEAVFAGTVRTFETGLSDLIRGRMESILQGIGQATGTASELQYCPGYISLVNDPARTDFAEWVVKSYLGEDAWPAGTTQSTGSEDFAYYLANTPGVFLRLGVGQANGVLHQPRFDFNDEALEPGILGLVALALETLGNA